MMGNPSRDGMTGPLAIYAPGFREALTRQGYARQVVRDQLRLMAQLSRWLECEKYFARNVRAIKVLIDREAISSGAATEGRPWQYFDLGHRYCNGRKYADVLRNPVVASRLSSHS